jgi:hypothetical protein
MAGQFKQPAQFEDDMKFVQRKHDEHVHGVHIDWYKDDDDDELN